MKKRKVKTEIIVSGKLAERIEKMASELGVDVDTLINMAIDKYLREGGQNEETCY